MAYISRDPFAREELHRENVYVYGQYNCDWCGQIRRTRPNGRTYLYRYSTETDGGRKFDHTGLFCCKSCHDIYHS